MHLRASQPAPLVLRQPGGLAVAGLQVSARLLTGLQARRCGGAGTGVSVVATFWQNFGVLDIGMLGIWNPGTLKLKIEGLWKSETTQVFGGGQSAQVGLCGVSVAGCWLGLGGLDCGYWN